MPKKPLYPLQQFKSGVAAKDAMCVDGLTLVIKSEDGSPECVKYDTKIQLLKRGWAITDPKNFGINLGRGPLTFEN